MTESEKKRKKTSNIAYFGYIPIHAVYSAVKIEGKK